MGLMNKNWDQADLMKVSKAVSDAINVIQTLGRTYGAPPDKVAVVELYSRSFAGKYAADQVIEAVKALPGEKLPMPHEIEGFISPAPVRVTEAQYVRALKDRETEGYAVGTEAEAIVIRYRREQSDPHLYRRQQSAQPALPAPEGQPRIRAAKRYFTSSGQPLNPVNVPPAHRAGYRQENQYEQHLDTTAHLRGNRAAV
jgi:hypothetical protein